MKFQPEAARLRMVEEQIQRRGVSNPKLLEVLKRVPREKFVHPKYLRHAYDDSALPIPLKQTISQPYIVAAMVEALDLAPSDRVLEVGTGSGYAAAVLSEMAQQVYTVERHGLLAQSAQDRLHSLGYHNVQVKHGDGTKGWPEKAPFDAIAVAAGGTEVPAALKAQLREGGRLVIPVGQGEVKRLLLLKRISADRFESRKLEKVRFVPLLPDLPESN